MTMKETSSHLLHIQPEDYGRELAVWLNRKHREPRSQRFIRALRLTLGLFQVRVQGHTSDAPENAPLVSGAEYRRRVGQIGKDLDGLLPKYHFGGRSLSSPAPKLHWVPVIGPGVSASLAEAVTCFLNLDSHMCLDRMRECRKCGKWFYARFRHQEFCATRCQQTYFWSTEEWKAKRREYMRRYKILKASGKVK